MGILRIIATCFILYTNLFSLVAQGRIVTEPSMIRSAQYYVDTSINRTVYFPDQFYLFPDLSSQSFSSNEFIDRSLSLRSVSDDNIMLYGIYHNPNRFFFILEDISESDDYNDHSEQAGYDVNIILDSESDHSIWHKKTSDSYEFFIQKIMRLNGRSIRYLLTGNINKSFDEISEAHLRFEIGILSDVFDFIVDEQNAHSNSYSGNLLVYMSNFFRNTANYNYVSTLNKLESLKNDAYQNKDTAGYNETLVTFLNFLGKNNEIFELDVYQERIALNRQRVDKVKNLSESFDYLAKLNEIAKIADILVINEDHYSNFNRNVLNSSLPTLADNGYAFLAIETLANSSQHVNKEGFPLHNSGYYTSDPVFGNVIRTASSLNMSMFGYEVDNYEIVDSSLTRAEFREKQQALNILEYLDRIGQNEKLVVFCGRSHGNKKRRKNQMKMASWLDSLSTKTVISIDQTSTIGAEELYSGESNSLHLISSPYVIERGYDFLLINNIDGRFDNCPQYCSNLGDNQLSVSSYYPDLNEDNVVTVFIKDEFESYGKEVVPIISCQNLRAFSLPVGNFVIQIVNGDGKLVCTETINIGQ